MIAFMHLRSFLKYTLQPNLLSNLLLCPEDCWLPTPFVAEYLTQVCKFLNYSRDYNWKVHPKKRIVFAGSVRWWGMDKSSAGTRLNPTALNALLSMAHRLSGEKFKQFTSSF